MGQCKNPLSLRVLVCYCVLAMTGCAVGPNFQKLKTHLPSAWIGPTTKMSFAAPQRAELVHWWMTFVGFITFFLVLTAAGLAQSAAYSRGVPVIDVLPGIRPLFIARAASGLMIIVAQYIFAYNVFMTVLGRQSTKEVRAVAANEAAVADPSAEPA